MTTIQITRPKEWQNRIRKYHIYVDNEKVGEVANGETKDFLITPGQHTVVAKIDWCSSPEFSHNYSSDEIQYLKVSSNKIMKWLPLLVFPILILNLFFRKLINPDYIMFLFVPVLLVVIYMLTFGRRKYLTLKTF
jgi:hypothetical protein